MKIVLDKAAVESLLPEGSEQRIELEGIAYEKVAEELFRKIKDKFNDKCVNEIHQQVVEKINFSLSRQYILPKEVDDRIRAEVRNKFDSNFSETKRQIEQRAREEVIRWFEIHENQHMLTLNKWWEKERTEFLNIVRKDAKAEFINVMREVQNGTKSPTN